MESMNTTSSTLLYPSDNGGRTEDICDRIALELVDNDEDFSPSPICRNGQILVVSALAVRDDLSLCNSDFADDMIGLLLMSNSNTIAEAADTIASSNSRKRRHSSSSPRRNHRAQNLLQPTLQQSIFSEAAHNYQHHQDNINNSNETRSGQKQKTNWSLCFQDLLDFKATHGHCRVPNSYPSNAKLAQWVKRQRYQGKLKVGGKCSTLTDERQCRLEGISFVWDSHTTSWMERWSELYEFRRQFGHSNVPSNFQPNWPLAIWVKCQRRQYKLYRSDKPSNMTIDRVQQLDGLDFKWDPRHSISTSYF
jgi:hypothetical protein